MFRVFKEMSAGTRWAYVGNGLGIGASIALNAAQAASRGRGWGPVVVAGSVPVFLYVALEILARKKITGWKRWITYPGFMTVVSVTFLTSYQDQAAILQRWGFETLSAAIFPIGIDGLMVIAAVALLEGDFVKPVEVVEEIVVEPIVLRPAAEEVEEPKVKQRPRRAPVTADADRAEYWARLETDDPLTAKELSERDGKGINSARSRIQRWKKAGNDSTMGVGGSAAIRGRTDGAEESGSLDVSRLVATDAETSGFQDVAAESLASA